MSTSNPSLTLDQALAFLPDALRKRLVKAYKDLKSNAVQGQYDTIGVKAGRLAEVLIRVLQNVLTGSYIPLRDKIRTFEDECDRIKNLPASSGPEGLRIMLPRALSFLYTLRNKRDAGHVGGEVDANKIDASTALRLADWCICEIIRVCHSVPIEDAQLLCDAITERTLPEIWKVLGRRRVLDTSLTYREQTLLLLYSEIDIGLPVEDLIDWTEHPRRTDFIRDVLSKLHKARLIEWDRDTDIAIISPTGIAEVEEKILPKLSKLGLAA